MEDLAALSMLNDVANEFLKHRRKSKLFLSSEDANENISSDFYARLKTYQPTWWVTKPVSLSPWLSSRYGWVCVEKDLLQCVTCKSYMSSHLPSITDVSLYEKCCDRFKASVLESHSETCVWRSAPVPLAECTPDVSDRQAALNDFIDRYEQIKRRFNNLKNIAFDVDSSLACITDDDLRTLSQLVDESSISFSNNVAYLALLGWKVSEKTESDSLVCNYCLRTLGLWLFRMRDKAGACSTNEDNSAVDEQSPGDRRKRLCTEKDRALCPVKQHYSWCPWIVAADSFSVLYLSSPSKASDSYETVPRWRALLSLLTKPKELMNSNDNVSLISEHFVLAKQLLDETLNRVVHVVDSSSSSSSNHSSQ